MSNDYKLTWKLGNNSFEKNVEEKYYIIDKNNQSYYESEHYGSAPRYVHVKNGSEIFDNIVFNFDDKKHGFIIFAHGNAKLSGSYPRGEEFEFSAFLVSNVKEVEKNEDGSYNLLTGNMYLFEISSLAEYIQGDNFVYCRSLEALKKFCNYADANMWNIRGAKGGGRNLQFGQE